MNLAFEVSSFSLQSDFFKFRKFLQHDADDFTFHPNEGVLRIFIALKNPSPWPGLGLMAITVIITPSMRLTVI
jgi:hypothetical protein